MPSLAKWECQIGYNLFQFPIHWKSSFQTEPSTLAPLSDPFPQRFFCRETKGHVDWDDGHNESESRYVDDSGITSYF